jgi:hypothetical protein
MISALVISRVINMRHNSTLGRASSDRLLSDESHPNPPSPTVRYPGGHVSDPRVSLSPGLCVFALCLLSLVYVFSSMLPVSWNLLPLHPANLVPV